MTRAAFVVWILGAALALYDASGHSRSMPRDLAEAIVEAAQARPVAGDAKTTAALLAVLAFRESSFRNDVTGDGGASCGAYQTPCAITPLRDWKAQTRIALDILERSFAACPEYPLAIYASGSCTSAAGRRISTARIAEAKALAVRP